MLYPFRCKKCGVVFTTEIRPINRDEKVRCETEGCDGWADRSLVVDIQSLEGLDSYEVPIRGVHY